MHENAEDSSGGPAAGHAQLPDTSPGAAAAQANTQGAHGQFHTAAWTFRKFRTLGASLVGPVCQV